MLCERQRVGERVSERERVEHRTHGGGAEPNEALGESPDTPSVNRLPAANSIRPWGYEIWQERGKGKRKDAACAEERTRTVRVAFVRRVLRWASAWEAWQDYC